FPLLLTGRLSARPMMFMFILLAGGLCYFAVRRLPAYWPAFRPAKASPPPEAGTPNAGTPEAGTTDPSTPDARTAKASPPQAGTSLADLVQASIATPGTIPTAEPSPKSSADPKTSAAPDA